MKNLNIILINYYSSPEIETLLNKFLNISFPEVNFQFFIVDNSGDLVVCEKFKKLKISIFNNGKNFGYCGGNNIAYEYILNNNIDGDILICNTDVSFTTNQLLGLALSVNQDGIYSLPAVDENGKLLYSRICLKGYRQKIFREKKDFGIAETDYCPGSFLYLSFDKNNISTLFDEGFFMYWEEVDLALRLKKRGIKSFFRYDFGSVVRGANPSQRIYNATYYYMRNARHLGLRHPEMFSNVNYMKFVLISMAVFLIKSVLKRDYKIIKNAIEGILAGLRLESGIRK